MSIITPTIPRDETGGNVPPRPMPLQPLGAEPERNAMPAPVLATDDDLMPVGDGWSDEDDGRGLLHLAGFAPDEPAPAAPQAPRPPRLDEQYRIAQTQREADAAVDWLFKFTGGYPQPGTQQPRAPRLDDQYRLVQQQRQADSDLDWALRLIGGPPQQQPQAPVPQPAPAPAPAAPQSALEELAESILNLGRQTIPGLVNIGTTGMSGVDTIAASGEQARQERRRWSIETMGSLDAGKPVTVPDSGNQVEDNQRRYLVAAYQRAAPAERAAFRRQIESDIVTGEPTPIGDRWLYRAGRSIQEWADQKVPLLPGYTQESWSTQLGRGLGSMIGGLLVSIAGGPVAGGALFGAAGMGEATERAVEFDKKEKAEGRPGLTQEQIIAAGLAGVLPGTTDVLPIEAILARSRIPGMTPQAARSLAKVAARFGGAVIFQAAIEGGQEGFQQLLQNAIAKDTYSPQQDLFEGVFPSVAVGSGVGAMAQTGIEAGRGLMGGRRRGGNAHSAPSQPGAQETQTSPAQPLDDAQIQRLLSGAHLAAPQPPETEAERLERVHRGRSLQNEIEVQQWLAWVRQNGWTPYDIIVARAHDPLPGQSGGEHPGTIGACFAAAPSDRRARA